MLFIDLDGTLLDVRERHYRAYREVLEQPEMRGVPVHEREYWVFKRRGGTLEQLLRNSRLFPTKYREFAARFADRLEAEDLLAFDRPHPGVEESLGKLYTKTPICLVTLRADRVSLERQLELLGLHAFFVRVIAGAPKDTGNPRWKFKAEQVRHHYKLLPKEAWFIGDTETDIRAAKELKLWSMALECGHRDKPLLIKAKPDWICPNLPAALEKLLPQGRWQK